MYYARLKFFLDPDLADDFLEMLWPDSTVKVKSWQFKKVAREATIHEVFFRAPASGNARPLGISMFRQFREYVQFSYSAIYRQAIC